MTNIFVYRRNNNLEVIKMGKEKDMESDFLLAGTPSSDGDILHLSEGISSDLGMGIMDFVLGEKSEEDDK